ncbi:hypothetical protein I33_2673 [Bacillus subtilis subsp. subtilis str. RO-NN-1]|nr:hypothetical protein I33_2673 [Bacillus subtilis subsp. subtilis str. RO-NN-1]
MTFQEGNYVCFEYCERNYLFFSTMLASKVPLIFAVVFWIWL